MPPSRDISLRPKARGDSATTSAGLLTVSRILLVFGPVLALDDAVARPAGRSLRPGRVPPR